MAGQWACMPPSPHASPRRAVESPPHLRAKHVAFVGGVGTLARKAWWRFAADSLDRFGVGNRREKRGFVT